MSDAFMVEAFTPLLKPMPNRTVCRLVGPGASGEERAAVSGTVPYAAERGAASTPGLPAASRAAPAGISTRTVPSAEGRSSNV